MIDFILVGFGAGLLAFLTLFFVSFFILGLITGIIHLIGSAYRGFFVDKSQMVQEQTG